MPAQEFVDHYAVLGVDRKASSEEIKLAWLAKIKDRHGGERELGEIPEAELKRLIQRRTSLRYGKTGIASTAN